MGLRPPVSDLLSELCLINFHEINFFRFSVLQLCTLIEDAYSGMLIWTKMYYSKIQKAFVSAIYFLFTEILTKHIPNNTPRLDKE